MTGRAEDGHAVAGVADGWLPTAGRREWVHRLDR